MTDRSERQADVDSRPDEGVAAAKPQPLLQALLSRRQVVMGATALVGGLVLAPPRILRAADTYSLPAASSAALAKSPLVYISPLRKSGAESSCHGEVWYFFDQGAVVIMTSTESWKTRSVQAGLDGARIWVGDFGPVKRAGDKYRAAPTFLAKAEIIGDRAIFDRLLSAYAERYADGWGKWGPRFEKGFADGSRKVIRYKPAGA
jgi:hypothetical protein